MTWGREASAILHRRYMQPVQTRRRCWCGCKQRATHTGFANGIALTAPLCELSVRRWVKTGDERAQQPIVRIERECPKIAELRRHSKQWLREHFKRELSGGEHG